MTLKLVNCQQHFESWPGLKTNPTLSNQEQEWSTWLQLRDIGQHRTICSNTALQSSQRSQSLQLIWSKSKTVPQSQGLLTNHWTSESAPRYRHRPSISTPRLRAHTTVCNLCTEFRELVFVGFVFKCAQPAFQPARIFLLWNPGTTARKSHAMLVNPTIAPRIRYFTETLRERTCH